MDFDVPVKVVTPTWSGADKLTPAARKEWDRAMKALADHEQGHVDLVKKSVQEMADKAVGMKPQAAKAFIKKALEKLQQNSDDFDKKTDHGKKTGTVINTSASNDTDNQNTNSALAVSDNSSSDKSTG